MRCVGLSAVMMTILLTGSLGHADEKYGQANQFFVSGGTNFGFIPWAQPVYSSPPDGAVRGVSSLDIHLNTTANVFLNDVLFVGLSLSGGYNYSTFTQGTMSLGSVSVGPRFGGHIVISDRFRFQPSVALLYTFSDSRLKEPLGPSGSVSTFDVARHDLSLAVALHFVTPIVNHVALLYGPDVTLPLFVRVSNANVTTTTVLRQVSLTASLLVWF